MKKAFTLLEIIFIIVIAGVISSVAIMKFSSKDLLKGVEMVAKDIEYTKHLAIIDDGRIPNDIFLEKANNNNFWTITFIGIGGDPKMSIFKYTDTNINYGTIDTAAIDYLDKEKVLTLTVGGGKDIDIVDNGMNKTSSRIYLKKTYGIKSINNDKCLVDGHSINTLFFNEEGVPYGANSSKGSFLYFQKLKETCTLKFKAGSDTKCIDIYPETGYVKVKECS